MKVEIDYDYDDYYLTFFLTEFEEPISWGMSYRLLELSYDDENMVDRDEDKAMDALIDAVEDYLDEQVENILEKMDCVDTTTNNPYAYMRCVYDANEEDMPKIMKEIAKKVKTGIVEIELDPEYEKKLEARKKLKNSNKLGM